MCAKVIFSLKKDIYKDENEKEAKGKNSAENVKQIKFTIDTKRKRSRKKKRENEGENMNKKNGCEAFCISYDLTDSNSIYST